MDIDWNIVSSLATAGSAVITGVMAVQTQRMVAAARETLELDRAPILGTGDLVTRLDWKGTASGPELSAFQLGVVLRNAGRVPVAYVVRKFRISGDHGLSEDGRVLSRSGTVLPGDTSQYYSARQVLAAPLTAANSPLTARIHFEVQYGKRGAALVYTISEEIECTISVNPNGFDIPWVRVDGHEAPIAKLPASPGPESAAPPAE